MFKRAVCSAFALSVLAGLMAAPTAVGGSLPAPGSWVYDIDLGRPLDGHAGFSGILLVANGQATLNAIQGTVYGGKCKQHGRTRPAGLVGFASYEGKIAVNPDGSFSGRAKVLGDATGKHGTATVKGVFNGLKVRGTMTVRMHDPAFGDCRGTGRFRDRGVPNQ